MHSRYVRYVYRPSGAGPYPSIWLAAPRGVADIYVSLCFGPVSPLFLDSSTAMSPSSTSCCKLQWPLLQQVLLSSLRSPRSSSFLSSPHLYRPPSRITMPAHFRLLLLTNAWSPVLSDFQDAFLHPTGIICPKGCFAMPFLPVVPPSYPTALHFRSSFPTNTSPPPP